MEVKVTPATRKDAIELSGYMREVDIREVRASHNHNPEQALKLSCALSHKKWAARVDGTIACIWGVADLSVMDKTGVPWMLGSGALEKVKIRFLRQSINYVDDMKQGYDLLRNYVDMRNELAIKWLMWLGFEFEEPVPYGPYNNLFYPFFMRC